jgi:hypothetical protein
MFLLRLVNDNGGEVAVSKDQGRSWKLLGRVTQYSTKVNPEGYTASKWVQPGHVAATAVNAIHISAGYNEAEDKGVIFSVLPREFARPPAHYQSFLSPDSSIYTDLPAGQGIFGGGEAPFVGSQVLVMRAEAQPAPLPDGYEPARGDVLIIQVARPEPYPVAVEFENREGGKILLRYRAGKSKQLGWVIRPVRGIGRFEGALYTGIGRLRANHAGVVDIATSPVGRLGAFQIIPVGHSLSPEMKLAWEKTQWMIVGPLPENTALWESLFPLFYQHLRPDYLPEDLTSDEWKARLLARFLVDVETARGYGPMPKLALSSDPRTPLPVWADTALAEVKKVRILFPLD